MTNDFLEFAPRHPRHETNEGTPARATVRRHGSPLEDPIEARLVDLSRSGFQFHATESFSTGEKVTMEIRDERSGLQLDLTGVIRWQRRQNDGWWAVGCQCEEELDWAVMGELFLHEVLSMD
jgi:hypothetical protein